MIDFHTHIFSLKKLQKNTEIPGIKMSLIRPRTGTARTFSSFNKEAGLEMSVILPVITKPSQFQSINRFAMQFQEGSLLSFGGIHPDNEDYKEKLKELKHMGFKGIKLHPDYQETFIDDIRYKRIISYASELDLIVSVHAGFDPGYPDCIHCPPQKALDVIRDVQPQKLVLAHMGGFMMWDEVEAYLTGENMDGYGGCLWTHTGRAVCTYRACPRCRQDSFLQQIPHGEDKKEFAEYFRNLPLSDEEKREAIARGNARKLLGMS